MGFAWQKSEKSLITIGGGLHSQLQPRFLYDYETILNDGSRIKTNRNLDFTKSIHSVIGYNYSINKDVRCKVEAYYQYMYSVPVKENLPYYSILNAGANYNIDKEDSLVNNGTGKNYGLEFTLEHFFITNYYYLVTLSLYESKYKGYNKIEKNTAFNGNYVLNLLGGYEFKIKNNLFNINLSTVWGGGRRYIPMLINKEPKYSFKLDWDNAYSQKYNDYFALNTSIGFTLNRPKFNIEWSMNFQNITNHKNVFIQKFDPTSGEIITEYQLGFLPIGKIKIEF